jgi:hypothetical protein
MQVFKDHQYRLPFWLAGMAAVFARDFATVYAYGRRRQGCGHVPVAGCTRARDRQLGRTDQDSRDGSGAEAGRGGSSFARMPRSTLIRGERG